MRRWYALHTRPYAERRVAQQLARWDIETFVPGADAQNGDQGARFRPLFPGYLFIHLNLEMERAVAWLNYPGVRYIVSYDDEPVPIQDEIVTLLRRKTAELASERKQGNTRFKPGGLVRIKDGPFKDMLAIFEGPYGPSQRVRVLLQALNRSMRLQLDPSNLDDADSVAEQATGKRPRRTRGRGRRIRS